MSATDTSNTIPPRLAYRPAELARLLGVSHDTVRRGIAAGDIHAVRLNRSILIPLGEVDRLLGGES